MARSIFISQIKDTGNILAGLTTANLVEGTNLYFSNARVYSNVIALLPTLAGSGIQIQANGQINANAAVVTFASISQFLTTSNVSEGTNLYFSNARVYSNILALLPTLAGSGITIQANGQISASTATVSLAGLTTSNLAEGTNLYYTNARVYAAIQGNLALKANVTDLTTANVSELTNLYYTNARVYSNVIALLPTLAGSGITIQANGQISASTATVSLAGLTTSNLAEGVNLYYTNARARTAYIQGLGIAISEGGVISARGDDGGTGLFNSGINLISNLISTASFSNVKYFNNNIEGNSFIGYSLHITNISGNTAYLTARHIMDSNITLFANLLEMPYGSSMEIFRKPQIFKLYDTVQIQGFDQNKNATTNGIAAYLSYQGTTDDTYQRAGNTISGNSKVTIFQSAGRTSIVESIQLVNLSPNNISTTVTITDSADTLIGYLASNLTIPPFTSVELCEYPKTMTDDTLLKVQKYDNQYQLSVLTSYKYTNSYTIVPSATSFAEGDSLIFDILTTNLVNGTQLYYELQYANSAAVGTIDFLSNLAGITTIQNGSARIALQSNADLNIGYVEGDRQYKLVLRKGTSNTGILVSTSNNVTLRDTSNVTSYSLTSNASAILESTDILFTLSTVNLPAGITYYWNTNNISSYFVTGNTGSFVSNANTSYNILLAANATATGTTTDFQLRILTGSQTGTVVATSNVITIVDAALAYMSATGGTIVDSDGYRTHVFTTSANLTIDRTGATPALSTIEYFAVAGGAAGGRSAGAFYQGGGGGGAGGLLTSNLLLSTGNTVITIGAGGALVAFNVWPLPPGGNTSVSFSGSSTITAFGGGGGAHSWPDHGTGFGPGRPGGSGGGGNFYGTFGSPRPAGNGTPGQGYSGGTSSPESYGGSDARTWAGGGGGAGEQGHWNPAVDTGTTGVTTTSAGGNGLAIPWAPSAYGTSGPAPGRYFAGGGGGGGSNQGTTYILRGGAGGGGAGGTYAPGYPTSAQALGLASGGFDGGADATINTGGGGGGAGSGGASSGTGLGGLGGSGIVLIRYPYVDMINITATGGNVTTIGGYKYHKFNTSANLNITSLGVTGNIEYLMVAGGAGGGWYGGGGGAGGLLYSNITATSTGNIIVAIGAGGAGGIDDPATLAINGSNTTISGSGIATVTAVGGGRGSMGTAPLSGSSIGGSGGGGWAGPGGDNIGSPGISGQGNPGGAGEPATGNFAGGGGGAGQAGFVGTSGPGIRGRGGNGTSTYSVFLNTANAGINVSGTYWIAGGGGGGGWGPETASPAGGLGGGGSGRTAGGSSTGTAGSGNVNTGGGGGGAGYGTPSRGGAGGSGIVIIRYPVA